jgi:amino acid transporter
MTPDQTTAGQAHAGQTGTEQAAKTRYSQDLNRSIGVLGNIFITLSGVTPAVSVFVIAATALAIPAAGGSGSGAFLSFVFAGVVGIGMALCWAELSAAFPIAGGDYALVWHAFRGNKAAERAGAPLSFVTFALWLTFIAFIPATIALGAGTYFSPIVNLSAEDGKLIGAAFMLIAAGIAALKIKFNAWLTGVFLGIELVALIVLTALGLAHARNWHALVHPGTGTAPVAFSAVVALTAVAIFSYNGYAGSVNFAEETTGSSRNVAKAILWSLVITVAAELIPLTATIVGAPSLGKLTSSAVPLEYFFEATSNKAVYNVISIGIVLAVLNAVVAIMLSNSRVLYSAARDKAYPGRFINSKLAYIHPKFGSPWWATMLIGVVGAVLCLTVSGARLTELTGSSLVADYALIALAAVVGRFTKSTKNSPYRMGWWWPLPPLLALAALGYVFTTQTKALLTVTLVTMAAGLVYWAAVIRPQRGRAWNLLAPIEEETEE